MKTLYVLYDDGCAFCRRSRDWLAAQESLVQFHPLAHQAPEVLCRFPGVETHLHPRELTVISDEGAVWHGPAAVVVCLHAIEEHRKLAAKLAEPGLLPYAQKAFELLQANPDLAGWLLYTPLAMLEQALRHYMLADGQHRPAAGASAGARPPALARGPVV